MAMNPTPLLEAIALATLAGLSIPLGGLLAAVERIHPRWLEQELRHSIIAFGGGALLAAVALVLVPEGSRSLAPFTVLVCFAGGGLVFMWLDRWLTRTEGPMAQLLALLLDFVPEAIALGAALALGSDTAFLLALLIALQNIPEAFNACREVRDGTGFRLRKILTLFLLLALLGPLAAAVGVSWFADHRQMLDIVMIVAAGGILYLIFQDIAPQARLERHWAPPLGAVAGFGLGLLGHLLMQ